MLNLTKKLCLILVAIPALAGLVLAQDVYSVNRMTVINYARTPVYAAAVKVPAETLYKALGLPTGTPLEAVTGQGDIVPLFPGKDGGADVVCAYLSLAPGERCELALRQAAEWGGGESVCRTDLDASTGRAVLANGVVRFEYQDDRWDLFFDGPMADAIEKPENRCLLSGCRIDLWLDSERRGRLFGVSPEKVRETGLIHSDTGKLSGGEADIQPDGSLTLRLTRRFEGFAADVDWTETYTLLPGKPVLILRLMLGTKGDAMRYLAFIEHGGGVRGNFGNLLRGELGFGYQDPRDPKRLLLAGNENGALRVAWRGERCWFAADSELGSGIGIATTRDVLRGLPGSRIWMLAPRGFFASFLDTEQENMPYEFCAQRPLELGFAFGATCGGVSVWSQTKQLFAAVTKDKEPPVSSSCAIYLGNRPLQAGEADAFVDDLGSSTKMAVGGDGLQAALTVDFQRPYQLSACAEGATPNAPLTIRVRPFDSGENPLTVMTLDQPGASQVDFTALTKWAGKRKTFVLEVAQPDGTRLTNLRLEPSGFPAPELETPIDGMSLTDLAVFFRWQQVKGAWDYELQLSRDASFRSPRTLAVRSEAEWPYYLPQDEELPAPGEWFWRVRAVEPGRPGAWSEARRMEINNDHSKRPVTFEISAERPLFTIEACRVKDMSKFINTVPEDIKPYVAFNCEPEGYHDEINYLKPLQPVGLKAFIRTHGPGVMSYWNPLANVEAIFQAYTNVIGIIGGETLSTHYHGGANQTYVNRLLKLCGKYGRIYYDADGTYPSENKWEALYAKEGALMHEYADYLIFAQKNNILHRQFVSQSSVLGLYLTGDILAQGAWEDGGWYWQQTGFRKLGEMFGQRGGEAAAMPRIFWTLNFAMGLGRGCSVFSFEGQTGTTPVPSGWKIAEHDDLPDTAAGPYRNPAAYWTTEGEWLPTFHRFCLPFMRAVINHRLVPTRDEVLKNVQIAVYNDGVPKKDDGDQYYYEWEALYRGAYGFRDFGVLPGTLMEFFPNTGRYYYFPVLPQGKRDLGKGIDVLPLSTFATVDKVKSVFDAAYPEWYTGNAQVNIVGDTLTVLNSNENLDETQTYTVPLNGRGGIVKIAGTIGPHAYVLGKLGEDALWLQANTEYYERGDTTELTLTCAKDSNIKVVPETAVLVKEWDAATKTLHLKLDHQDGAVEVSVTSKQTEW